MITETEQVVLAFTMKKLFVNRDDCYIKQNDDGSYDKIKQRLTPEVLYAHLKGDITVATYQLNQFNEVKWICFDIDPEHNSEPLKTARKIIKTCIAQKLFSEDAILLECSRYPDNSYHVWILFDMKIPADVAQWLGKAVIRKSEIKEEVEIFPKQTRIGKNGYGNGVKVPLGFHQVEHKFSKFLDFNTLQPLSDKILFDVKGTTLSKKDIDTLQQKTTKKSIVFNKNDVDDSKIRQKIRPCITVALNSDLTGSSENHKMRVAIVAEYNKTNYSKEKIVALFSSQKDFDHTKTTKQVEHIVSKPYPPFKCSTIRELGYCIGIKCPIFRKKQRLFEKEVEELQ